MTRTVSEKLFKGRPPNIPLAKWPDFETAAGVRGMAAPEPYVITFRENYNIAREHVNKAFSIYKTKETVKRAALAQRKRQARLRKMKKEHVSTL